MAKNDATKKLKEILLGQGEQDADLDAIKDAVGIRTEDDGGMTLPEMTLAASLESLHAKVNRIVDAVTRRPRR